MMMRTTLLATLALVTVGAFSSSALAAPAPHARGGCDDGRYYVRSHRQHHYRPAPPHVVYHYQPRPRVIHCPPPVRYYHHRDHYIPKRPAVRFNLHVGIHGRGGGYAWHGGYSKYRYRDRCD